MKKLFRRRNTNDIKAFQSDPLTEHVNTVLATRDPEKFATLQDELRNAAEPIPDIVYWYRSVLARATGNSEESIACLRKIEFSMSPLLRNLAKETLKACHDL